MTTTERAAQWRMAYEAMLAAIPAEERQKLFHHCATVEMMWETAAKMQGLLQDIYHAAGFQWPEGERMYAQIEQLLPSSATFGC